ncbi:hypothetical protein IAU60_003862 [Kwoniella sp. DSM 27419]
MVSFVGLNLPNNLSLYAIPAMWFINMSAHFYAVGLYNAEKAPGDSEWDNRAPKKNLTTVKEAKLSPAAQGKFERAEAAQSNGFENLPFFAAAVVAGNLARLPVSTLHTAVGIYLASRAVYTWIYINNTTKTAGNLRSATYLVGIITCFTLFIKSGNALSLVY